MPTRRSPKRNLIEIRSMRQSSRRRRCGALPARSVALVERSGRRRMYLPSSACRFSTRITATSGRERGASSPRISLSLSPFFSSSTTPLLNRLQPCAGDPLDQYMYPFICSGSSTSSSSSERVQERFGIRAASRLMGGNQVVARQR